MLRILRKVRQNLLHSGNIRKYGLYALGEFLLIVAGVFLIPEKNRARFMVTIWDDMELEATDIMAMVDTSR